MLLGMAVELHVSAILTTSVSRHARRAVREADVARRMMYAAREAQVLPKGMGGELATVHEKHPFPYSAAEIEELARGVRDPNFRVQVAEDGLHVYNRAGHWRDVDPFAIYPELDFGTDAGHAFYMGVQLARAEIAWQLGKRFNQDEPLDWGCAVERAEEDLGAWCAPGTTMKK